MVRLSTSRYGHKVFLYFLLLTFQAHLPAYASEPVQTLSRQTHLASSQEMSLESYQRTLDKKMARVAALQAEERGERLFLNERIERLEEEMMGALALDEFDVESVDTDLDDSESEPSYAGKEAHKADRDQERLPREAGERMPKEDRDVKLFTTFMDRLEGTDVESGVQGASQTQESSPCESKNGSLKEEIRDELSTIEDLITQALQAGQRMKCMLIELEDGILALRRR